MKVLTTQQTEMIGGGHNAATINNLPNNLKATMITPQPSFNCKKIAKNLAYTFVTTAAIGAILGLCTYGDVIDSIKDSFIKEGATTIVKEIIPYIFNSIFFVYFLITAIICLQTSPRCK